MTFIPVVPFVPPGRFEPAGPPVWLKLEPGEVFVRVYGDIQPQRRKAIIAAVLGLLVFAQLGVFFFLQAGDSSAGESSGQPITLMALIAGLIVILGIALAVKLAVRKRGAANQAVLTSKMLVLKSGNDIAGINLGDIVRMEPKSDSSKKAVLVFIAGQARPVAALVVQNLDAAIAELTAYASAAGAKFK
jgi:hypothetical protein